MLVKVVVALSILFSSVAAAEAVWIDVRSAIEHRLDNIEGDIRITHTEILEEVSKLYSDKETEIHLYCRSGVRAGKAMSELIEAGYTNVHNAGGIDDARKVRSMDETQDAQD